MMHNLYLLFIYTFSSSALLVYGIGLEKAFFTAHPGEVFQRTLPSLFLNAALSVSVLWFVITGILVPYNLHSLVPITVILTCGIIQAFMSLILPYAEQTPTGEKILFFGVVFLALYQANSFGAALVIVGAAFLSFALCTVILYAIRDRLASGHPFADWKGAPLILVSMGLLFIVLYSADISWWLLEVLG